MRVQVYAWELRKQIILCYIHSFLFLVFRDMSKKARGAQAENLVADYLVSQGLHLDEKNRTMRGGEIDLICFEDDVLVIVEVKSIDFIDDMHSYVTPKKITHLKHSMQQRIRDNNREWPVRLDVVYVQGSEIIGRFQNITNS